ncbi:MAG: DUF3107 domain-containing protein [Actinobacteria bacterium]|jgi:hypothetical protein|nr:DUF3107 domain-containing protein [Actinomycetota bacterium]
MEIRIGIAQVARELMVEVSSDALIAKAREAITAALNGKSETLSITDDKGREVVVASAKVAYVEFGAPEGARKLGFGS